jgi:hypothetical protein
MILNEARRSARYSREEIDALDFSGKPPDAGQLSRQWKQILLQGEELIALLPVETVGTCVLDSGGSLFKGGAETLREELKKKAVIFHRGSIRGAFPVFPEASGS